MQMQNKCTKKKTIMYKNTKKCNGNANVLKKKCKLKCLQNLNELILQIHSKVKCTEYRINMKVQSNAIWNLKVYLHTSPSVSPPYFTSLCQPLLSPPHFSLGLATIIRMFFYLRGEPRNVVPKSKD